LNLNFIHRTTNLLSEPPFGGVRCNVRTSSIGRWKAIGRLPIRDTLRRYKQILVEVGVFQRGWVSLSANFRWKRTSPTDIFWCQKTRVVTLSCGIKISAVCSFVSSQSTRVTDGQTELRSQDCASIAASRGKNVYGCTFHEHVKCVSCICELSSSAD